MATEQERMAAYVLHDHNVAWRGLWDRCEQAEGEAARLREALLWLDAWVSKPANSYSFYQIDGFFQQARAKISAALVADGQEQAKE